MGYETLHRLRSMVSATGGLLAAGDPGVGGLSFRLADFPAASLDRHYHRRNVRADSRASFFAGSNFWGATARLNHPRPGPPIAAGRPAKTSAIRRDRRHSANPLRHPVIPSRSLIDPASPKNGSYGPVRVLSSPFAAIPVVHPRESARRRAI